ncbi:MAG: hypothetical protein KatS3mg110_2076 [Pirellulaceae bacterium]|nr:MAG: hypothetical protein KatS3mg110_2076 [Pirellulaceae bacterium]
MSCLRSIWTGWLSVVLVVLGALGLSAQQKPAVVISLASVQEQMADVRYVTQAAGAPQVAGLVEFMSAQYTQVLDPQKPGGAAVWLGNDGTPTVLGFLPVKDMNLLKNIVSQQLGPVQDRGNGVLEIPGPMPLFVKSVGAYAYISNAAENLTDLPQDPAVYLKDTDPAANIGVLINVQAVPQPLKDMALQNLEQIYALLAEQAETEAERQFQQSMSKMVVDQYRQIFKEGDQIRFGLNIDAQAKQVSLDFQFTALPGTALAEQMTGLREQSDFRGFYQPNAAAAGVFSQTLSQSSLAQLQQILDSVKKTIENALAEDEDLSEEERQTAEKLLNQLHRIVETTCASGSIDGGFLLTLDGESPRLVVGGHVADGNEVKKLFDDVTKVITEEEEVPDLKIEQNAASVGGVSFTRYTLPTPDEDLAAVVGETLEFGTGVGPTTCVITFGKGSVELAKQVLESSAAGSEITTPVNQCYMVTGPVLEFIAKLADLDDNPAMQAARAAVARANGKDRIVYALKSVPNGVHARIALEEGVIGAIGAAITAFTSEEQ